MAKSKNSQVSLFVACLLIAAAVAGGDPASDFLDQKEREVEWIAGNATINDLKSCDLQASCQSACSRMTCVPVIGDIASSFCVNVENNNFCSANGGGPCSQMFLNYKRSYVTLPPNITPTNLPGPEVAIDVCTQRKLDDTFTNISFSENFLYAYFGSTSGVWRSFPGREESEIYCNSYETRRRPWYIDGVSVTKEVVVLLDGAASMHQQIGPDYFRAGGDTYYQVAVNLTTELLQTLAPGDSVYVFNFNSTQVVQIDQPVTMSPWNRSSPESRPELSNLTAALSREPPNYQAGVSNLTAAIATAANTFVSTGALKIIIVFTGGGFAPLNATTFPNISDTKLMVYKILQADTSDVYMMNTTLPAVLCSVNGTFEVVDGSAATNPLYALRSLFTFLASTHQAAAKNKPTWSSIYESFSQNKNVTSVTFPAFSASGELLGVAGIDIFPDLLGDLQSSFASNLGLRVKPGLLPLPSLTTLTCSIANQSVQSNCNSTNSIQSAGICNKTDTVSTLPDLVCCGMCRSTHTGINKKTVGIAVGVVAGALLVAAIVCIKRREIRECFRGDDRPPDLPRQPPEAAPTPPPAATPKSEYT